MFVAAVGGGGSDSGILQEFERTRDSCLAGWTRKDSRTHWVFISPCLSSDRPAEKTRGRKIRFCPGSWENHPLL